MITELGASLELLEDALWLVTAATGVPGYDFRFSSFFSTRHPWQRESTVQAIGRLGATGDYEERYTRLLTEDGIQLIHSPPEHLLCSQLPNWYPFINDLTPRSRWYDEHPTWQEVESEFAWPIFLKGARQTSHHRRELAIIENREAFVEAMAQYSIDPILRWQTVVCREFVPLRAVGEQPKSTLPRSFEFRTWWWKQSYVGAGAYWTDVHYTWTRDEERDALLVAREAARRLQVAFLVIDVAQTNGGQWIVVECNDGQDSGYRAAPPVILWRRILDCESGTLTR
jgi:hypothetical protein